MIFGKGERRRTERTSNENLTKSAEIAAFWQGSYYSCLAYSAVTHPSVNSSVALRAPPSLQREGKSKRHRER